MSLSCGLVGLPNVGKSTLFNTILKKSAAQAANYPFCTIEPNVGKVPVPDGRLNKLSEISNSHKIIPALLECVDIAGLVKGAHEGQGLGNQFLGHIREVDLIVQVLRCFEDSEIVHVEGTVDPVRDYNIISMELQFADMAQLEKILSQKKGLDPAAKQIAEKARDYLARNYFLNTGKWKEDELRFFSIIGLLTYKPMIVVGNVKEAGDEKYIKAIKENLGIDAIKVSAELENFLQELESEEARVELLAESGFDQDGLGSILQEAYKQLNLITYFTTGKQETRAWKVKKGSTMQEASREIHTDFYKAFISADVVKYEDFIAAGGWNEAKIKGLMKTCSKSELVNDGDICIFKTYLS